MFIENKYYNWYCNLVSRRDRIIDGYTERHHIIPKSMGGLDDNDNLVILTAREHYIAHLLLTKCVTKEFFGKMNSAYVMMARVKDSKQKRHYKINSRLFEARKIEADRYKREYVHTDEAKLSISQALKGVKKKPFTEEHKRNISEGHKGQIAWNKGLKGVQQPSDNQKRAASESSKGMVACFDKLELCNTRVTKEIYHSNKDRYISFASKEYIGEYK